MQTSIFLAQLIGPVLLTGAISLFVNGERQRAMAREFLESPPLIYLSGILVMTAGLAIVLNHNVWALDWRILITLVGWMALIGGAFRILFFDEVEKIGEKMLNRPWSLTIGGVVWLVIAVVLIYFGYFA
jgi:hypothetical protein